ncbi:MAG: xanthine dehydrogenase small subunit [Planctomycetaceae bacterium]|jgi:xanthine dehydrogenase small subunit
MNNLVPHAEEILDRSPRTSVEFQVNHRLCQVTGGDVFQTVSEFVRERLGWTGTKTACEEGDCGSCTVLVGRPAGEDLVYQPVNSCIRFVYQLDGCHLVTIEGLAPAGCPTPVQQALIDGHGSQCGFCTPGFVMAMTAAGMRPAGTPAGTPLNWPVELAGNLCRCTGYVPILEAARRCERLGPGAPTWPPPAPEFQQRWTTLQQTSFDICGTHHGRQRRVVSPVTLDEALQLRATLPDSQLIAGGTDLGVLWTKRREAAPVWIDLRRVEEFQRISLTTAGMGSTSAGTADVLQVGALVTWAELLRHCETHLPEFARLLSRFGGPQIRAVGTIGGNLANASAIADAFPFLSVLDATLQLASVRGRRTLGLGEFLKANHQTALERDELLVGVTIPRPAPQDRLRLYKISRRRDLDISTITAAIRIADEGGRITRAAIAVGGAGPTVRRLAQVEAWLLGRSLDEETFRQAGELAAREVTPWSDVRGSADYRRQLVGGLVQRFFHEREAIPAVGE